MAIGNAIIGALRVVLGADTAQLETGLKSAQGKVDQFGSGFAKAAAAVAAAGAVIGGGLAIAVRSTINEFDSLSKTAQKIGIATEQLSALRHAAELSDVDAETLQKGIQRLANNSVQAAQGLQTYVRAFEALGVNVKDGQGNIKSMSQLLPEIMDRFAGMRDGTVKTALAIQIFGRAGAEMIPLLNSGASGLKEMTDEAKALGLTISGDTGKTAEAFNDNLTRLKAVMTGVVTQFTANILPALAQFSQFMIDGARNSGFLESAVNVLTTAFNGIARAAIVVYDNIGLITQIAAVFVGARIGAAAIEFGLAFLKLASAIRATGIVLALFEVIRGASVRGLLLVAGIVALAAGAFDDFSEKIKKVGEAVANMLPEGTGKAASDLLKSMGLNLEGLTANLNDWKNAAGKDGGGLFNPQIIKSTKDALESFIASQEKQRATLQAQAQTIGQSVYETERLKVANEAAAIAQANHIGISAAMQMKIDALAESMGRLAEKVQFGKQLYEQTRTPLEVYQQQIEQLNGALQRGSIDQDTYARGVAQAQQQFTQASPVAQAFGQSLETAFGNAITSGNKLSDVIKSLLQDLARALANEAFRALLYGTKGGTSGGLLGGASGLIGGIGKLFGFAQGGSFSVGGAGGIDSQVVAFRASPNETVSVSKDGGGGSAGGTISVVFSNDVDGNGNIVPVVKSVSGVVAGQRIVAATPGIVTKSLAAVAGASKRRPSAIGQG